MINLALNENECIIIRYLAFKIIGNILKHQIKMNSSMTVDMQYDGQQMNQSQFWLKVNIVLCELSIIK